MPTGCVLDAEEWEAVAALVRETGAWLLYDAAMERILFRRPYYLHPASLEVLGQDGLGRTLATVLTGRPLSLSK